jgi:hypothetical protein
MNEFVSAAPAAQQVAFGRRCMVYGQRAPARRDGSYYGLNLGLLDLRPRETSLGSNCNSKTHGPKLTASVAA